MSKTLSSGAEAGARGTESALRPFSVRHRVTLQETNAVGGVVYFAEFVRWQGIAREEFFTAVCPEWKAVMREVYEGRLCMNTVEEHSLFKRHVSFGEMLRIEVRTAGIRHASFDLLFRINNEKADLVYEGMQRLGFADASGKAVPVPDAMMRAVRAHGVPPGGESRQHFTRHLG